MNICTDSLPASDPGLCVEPLPQDQKEIDATIAPMFLTGQGSELEPQFSMRHEIGSKVFKRFPYTQCKSHVEVLVTFHIFLGLGCTKIQIYFPTSIGV